jgi:hypothetical protein
MESNSNRLDYLWVNDENNTKVFDYDYRGNLTLDGYKMFSFSEYDHRNLPLYMSRMELHLKFDYDDAGLRICKDVGGEKEYYLRDHNGKELAVYDLSTGKLKMVNLFGSGLIGRADVFWNPDTCYDEFGNPYICYTREDEIFYYLKDHLGSIRATIDKTGEVVAAQDYYPFA